MSIVISSFFHVVGTLYLYEKLLGKQNISKHPSYFRYPILAVLFALSYITLKIIPILYFVVFTILFVLYSVLIYKTKFDLSIFITVISRALYHTLYEICSFFITLICIPYYYFRNQMPGDFLILLNGLLTYAVLHLLFKLKRLKSGMSFITNIKFIYIGICASFIILILKTVDYFHNYNQLYSSNLPLSAFIPFAIFILAILLFYWWRNQITRSYIEKLQKLEIQSLYDELAEKEKQIKQLTEDNNSLAQIIHKDNKLIPALENAVSDFLLHEDFSDVSHARQQGEALAHQLQTISQGRKGLLKDYDNQDITLYRTGVGGIDNILNYMQKEAASHHIAFICKHTPEVLANLLKQISEPDLVHLLSDLLANAINATKEQTSGKLLVTFGQLDKEVFISISDTGKNFDVPTLHSLGLNQHTTHPEDGGSGIGWMDIWKLKKKYRASIQIQEYSLHKDNFTKKITFSFNSKNHYVIQSYRHMDIINTQTRGDLYVIPFTKDSKKGEKNL